MMIMVIMTMIMVMTIKIVRMMIDSNIMILHYVAYIVPGL